jgi:RNA polymerase sigma factor (sigma-70 family)
MGDERPAPGSDADYLLRSLSRPQEFSVLYSRHSDAVFRFLSRQADRNSAEDLLAETFLTAFRVRDRFDHSASSSRAWLFGIAANVARHHHRSQFRLARLSRRLQHRFDPASGELLGLEQRLDADAGHLLVDSALGQLTRPQREVLLLTAFELTYEEIANALNVPVGTVRSRLSRARTHMRELLGPNGKYPLVEFEQTPSQVVGQGGETDG